MITAHDRNLTPYENTDLDAIMNDRTTLVLANEILGRAIAVDEPAFTKRIATAKHGISKDDAQHLTSLANDAWDEAVKLMRQANEGRRRA